MKSPLIYIVAGEASGDALGAGLMQALATQRHDLRFAGIGGEAMHAQGLQSLFPYQELSIMGFLEVLPHLPALLKRLRETEADIEAKQPDIIITIDSPGFTFRLARALKKNPKTAHIKRIHYVAPSVWAYKPARAKKTAQLFDALLTLLPFEPPYFEKEGLAATFVGHPVLWEKTGGDAAAFRQRHNILADTPILLVLPGSRKGEIRYQLQLFMEAARALLNVTPVILASPQVKQAIAQSVPAGIRVIDISEKRDAFAAATLALTKSGTISLELAAAGVPMVVAHRGNPFSAWLIKRMILIKYVSLANIAVNRAIIPELLQENCNLIAITDALKKLERPEIRQEQRRQCLLALSELRNGNDKEPSVIAAETVLSFLPV